MAKGEPQVAAVYIFNGNGNLGWDAGRTQSYVFVWITKDYFWRLLTSKTEKKQNKKNMKIINAFENSETYWYNNTTDID